MSLFVFVCALWGIGKAIAAARERARQREAERIKREQKRQREEQARLREDFRRIQAEAKDRARRQAEIARETVRLAKEQERQRKEQEKQAAQIAKHDEEIRKLKQTAKRLSAKLEDLELRIIDLESVKELVYKQFLDADHTGDDARKEKALRKLISIDNQLSAAKDARQKTLDGIENAERNAKAKSVAFAA